MTTQTIERPVQRPAADLETQLPGRRFNVTSLGRDSTGAATAIAGDPLAPRLDDGSHTPPHGDALRVHGGGGLS
jgi:hypothetical protein